MKTLVTHLAVCAGLISSATAAISFSGGTGGDPVVMTLTSDLRLPIQFTGTGISFLLVLEDAYLTGQPTTYSLPGTTYGNPGGITAAFELGGGGLVEFSGYANSGTIGGDYARVDPNDLILGFTISGLGGPVTIGDTLVIRAGSVTLPAGVALPNGVISSVIGTYPDGTDLTMVEAVPEPSAAVLGLSAAGLLWGRRRRAA